MPRLPRATTFLMLVAAMGAWTSCAQLRAGPVDAGPGDATADGAGDDATGDASTDAEPELPGTFTVALGSPVGETFQAVWAADPQDVFVVGTGGVHEDYSGGQWTRSQNITGRDYYALWGTSAMDVYAVGEVLGDHSGVVQHFDGTAWHDEYLAPTPLYGIWGTGYTSQDVVMAVGPKGLLYGKQIGTTAWGNRVGQGLPANPDVPQTPDSPILWSISGIDFSDFFIAADRDRVFHWLDSLMGFEWLDPSPDTSLVFHTVWQSPIKAPSAFFGLNYYGVAWYTNFGPSQFDAALVQDDAGGPNDYLFLLNLDQAEPGSDGKFIRGIWGTASSVVFCGDEGRIYSYASGKDNFARVQSPTDAALYGASGTGPKDVWLVGEREIVLHGSLPQ